jgi:hypothetical protein
MRPRTLNRLSSAISNTLPQSGQFGRLKFSVAKTRVDGLVYADCKFIVGLLDVSLSAPISCDILRDPYGGLATPS